MSDPNSVGRLQEWTQKKKIPPPNYVETVSSDGSFLASVTILGAVHVGKGEGSSKMLAKQAASRDLIRFMKYGAQNARLGSSVSGSTQPADLASVECSLSRPSPSPTPSTSTPLRLTSTPSPSPAASSNANYVSRLQEWAQGRGLLFPVYRDIPSKEKRNPFCVVVSVPTKEGVEGRRRRTPTKEGVEGRGAGRTKKEAKQAAAKALYEALTDASGECAAPQDSPSKPGNSLSLSASASPSSTASSNVSNFIGELQKMAQKQNLPLPEYDFDSAEKASSLGFPFVCTVKAFGASAQGGGNNKKEAKQEAAKELWMMVDENAIPKVTSTSAAIDSTSL